MPAIDPDTVPSPLALPGEPASDPEAAHHTVGAAHDTVEAIGLDGSTFDAAAFDATAPDDRPHRSVPLSGTTLHLATPTCELRAPGPLAPAAAQARSLNTLLLPMPTPPAPDDAAVPPPDDTTHGAPPPSPGAPSALPAWGQAGGLRNTAERTGRTGIFFTPQQLADGDIVDLPAFDAAAAQDSGWQYVTGRPANRARRFIVTRMAPVLGLSAVILWSYLQLSGDRTRPKAEAPPTPITRPDTAVAPLPPASTEFAQLPEDIEPELAPPDLKLATADVTEILADGTAAPRRMNQIFSRQRVTVLNLWATYCVPCRDELPAFRQLFEQQRTAWRGEVEFVPVQIDDPVDGAAARRDHTTQMPPFRHFLSDRGLPTGIKAALAADGRAPVPWSLPVTVVVHCNGKIEELFAQSFKTLDDLRPVFDAVDRARRKLPKCRAQRSTASTDVTSREAPTSQPPEERCGKIICQSKVERCVQRHPPAFKPACVPRSGAENWGAP